MDSIELYSFLKDYYANLDDLGWLLLEIVFFSTISIVFISYACKTISSALLSMMTLLISLFVMKLIKYFLKKDLGLTAEELRHVWYITYGAGYLFFVFFIGWVHKIASLPLSKYSKMISLTFLILGLTVLLKYVLRVYLGIDSEDSRYVYGLIINSTKVYATIATLIIAIYSLCIFVKKLIKNKNRFMGKEF
jgi:hypothetical protein